jgi:hypothetical protein
MFVAFPYETGNACEGRAEPIRGSFHQKRIGHLLSKMLIWDAIVEKRPVVIWLILE